MAGQRHNEGGGKERGGGRERERERGRREKERREGGEAERESSRVERQGREKRKVGACKIQATISCQHHDLLVRSVIYPLPFPSLLTKGLPHALVHVDGVCVLHKLSHYFPLLILYHQYLLRLGHATDHHQTNLCVRGRRRSVGCVVGGG